jgi:N6-adenosine-specific RNA methylase IME4
MTDLVQIRPAQIRSGKLLEVARRALVEADELPDIAALVDRAEVIRTAARKARLSLDAQNDWAEFKLDAQRKAGRMLAEMAERGERSTGGKPLQDATVKTLPELGIERTQAHRWQELAELPDETFEQFKAEARADGGEITTAGALRLARLTRIAEARQRQPEPVQTPGFPDGPFRCVLLDPPWPVEKVEREARPNQGLKLDYPTMTLDEIAALPIPRLADQRGAHIYLWVTHKFLPAGLELLAGWGARYECPLTWNKDGGTAVWSWLYDTEHCLFARFGDGLPLERMGLRLSFAAPRARHSTKPEVFYDRVREASPGPRLELFARTEREGFTPWGNEVSADADLAG